MNYQVRIEDINQENFVEKIEKMLCLKIPQRYRSILCFFDEKDFVHVDRMDEELRAHNISIDDVNIKIKDSGYVIRQEIREGTYFLDSISSQKNLPSPIEKEIESYRSLIEFHSNTINIPIDFNKRKILYVEYSDENFIGKIKKIVEDIVQGKYEKREEPQLTLHISLLYEHYKNNEGKFIEIKEGLELHGMKMINIVSKNSVLKNYKDFPQGKTIQKLDNLDVYIYCNIIEFAVLKEKYLLGEKSQKEDIKIQDKDIKKDNVILLQLNSRELRLQERLLALYLGNMRIPITENDIYDNTGICKEGIIRTQVKMKHKLPQGIIIKCLGNSTYICCKKEEFQELKTAFHGSRKIEDNEKESPKIQKLLSLYFENEGTLVSEEKIIEIIEIKQENIAKYHWDMRNKNLIPKGMSIKFLGKELGMYVYCKEEDFEEIKQRFIKEEVNIKIEKNPDNNEDISHLKKETSNHENIFKKGTRDYHLYNMFIKASGNNIAIKEALVLIGISRGAFYNTITSINKKLKIHNIPQKIKKIQRGIYILKNNENTSDDVENNLPLKEKILHVDKKVKQKKQIKKKTIDTIDIPSIKLSKKQKIYNFFINNEETPITEQKIIDILGITQKSIKVYLSKIKSEGLLEDGMVIRYLGKKIGKYVYCREEKFEKLKVTCISQKEKLTINPILIDNKESGKKIGRNKKREPVKQLLDINFTLNEPLASSVIGVYKGNLIHKTIIENIITNEAACFTLKRKRKAVYDFYFTNRGYEIPLKEALAELQETDPHEFRSIKNINSLIGPVNEILERNNTNQILKKVEGRGYTYTLMNRDFSVREDNNTGESLKVSQEIHQEKINQNEELYRRVFALWNSNILTDDQFFLFILDFGERIDITPYIMDDKITRIHIIQMNIEIKKIMKKYNINIKK